MSGLLNGLGAGFGGSALLCALLLAGCSEDDRPTAASDGSGGCATGLDCRTVEVPQAHANPGGPTIGLKVVIAHTPAGAGHAPIVYLEGGPGGTVEGAIPYAQTIADKLGRDFVLLEQRGNTLSKPALDCGITDFSGANATVLQSCTTKYSQLGYRIEAFNTIENAHDVDDVRRALGVPKVVLWGGSYGGELAQTIARLHPDAVAGELLESSAMSGRPYRPMEQIRAQSVKLEAFFTWLDKACREDDTCAMQMPSLDSKAELAKFQAAVATKPFVLTPAATIDSADSARNLVIISMYGIANAALVIRMMYAANHDQLATFDQMKVGTENPRDYILRIISFESVNRSSNSIYDCYDTVLNWTDDGVKTALDGAVSDADRPALDAEFAATRAACAALPPASVPQSELAISAVTSVPTLFIHGGLDWPTPLEYVQSDIKNFSRSQLVQVPCAGHGIQSLVPECFAKIASTFFAQAEDGSYSGAVDGSCVTDLCRPGASTQLFPH